MLVCWSSVADSDSLLVLPPSPSPLGVHLWIEMNLLRELMSASWKICCEIELDTLASSVTAVIAVLALCVGLYQLRQQRKLAAKRATLDLIMNSEAHNAERKALKQKFDSLKDSRKFKPDEGEIRRGLDALDDEQDRADVIAYLNHFEFVAVTIRHKIIDKNLYKTWSCSTYVRTR